ncbi:hypothetical protein B0J11DRAFT_594245 [Dendryphion nanum]|uniref:Uncharacterized protein n=1 Tax=Dendryphion nanum TaxID=256645 RepID=A0A9P9D9U5_9PLEO|nr:hypothetical protein B0J11DRAFT_594245 [Dendryphion nanum]
MSNSSSLPLPKVSEPVKGVTVFWPLLALALASCLQPLGSTCGEFSTRYRHSMRVLPLSGLLDSIHLIVQCYEQGTIAAIFTRVDANNPDLISPASNLSSDATAPSRLQHLNRFMDFFFDFKARAFPDLFVIFTYVKLCTLSGVPFSLTLGSVYFLSWLVMETVLMAQLFKKTTSRASHLHHAVTSAQIEESSRWISLRKLRGYNRILIAAQLIAIFVLAVFGVSQLARSTQTVPFHHTFNIRVASKWALTPYFLMAKWGSFPLTAAAKKVPNNVFLAFIYVATVVTSASIFAIFSIFIVCFQPFAVIRMVYKIKNLRVVTFLVLGGSVVYYGRIFDPTGTSKRSWSDILG